MSDLIGNLEDRFSRVTSQTLIMLYFLFQHKKLFIISRPGSEPASPSASRSTTPGPDSGEEDGGPVRFGDDDNPDDDDEELP